MKNLIGHGFEDNGSFEFADKILLEDADFSLFNELLEFKRVFTFPLFVVVSFPIGDCLEDIDDVFGDFIFFEAGEFVDVKFTEILILEVLNFHKKESKNKINRFLFNYMPF